MLTHGILLMCRLLIAGIPLLLPPNPHANHITSAGPLIAAALCPALVEVSFDTGFNLIYLPK
jgi:hypothetical protein